ncbi:hypothetical protein JB92DRAFT_2867069 [Gautieria morchelliformis]|nr:hypothetical protein JB92DRAFT_2867069 [Gautieria morchelliformis]
MPVAPRLALIILLSLPFVHPATAIYPSDSVWRRANVPPEGFFDPNSNHGSMLTFGFPTSPPNLGEPLNMIISASSHPDVLKDQLTSGGLRNYFLSLQFSSECLGQHLGDHQMADLGDGHGAQNETAVIRYNYGDPSLGSCKESVEGGNHFRYWVQDGPKANSGAIFMAVSYELPASSSHDLIFDGYNLARDWVVGNITGSAIPTAELTNTSSYTGTTQNDGYTYQTSVKYTGGLLPNSSNGINHFLSVGGGPNNITAIDGLVAVLTVNITAQPANTQSAAPRSWTLSLWTAPATIWLAILLALNFASGLA